MKTIGQLIVLSAFLVAGPAVAGGEKDCLLKGTVHHADRAGQETTMVKIHSVEKYADESRCRVRGSQKMEFKLPADTRVQEAPAGSEVKYRYRDDGEGDSSAELISIGA